MKKLLCKLNIHRPLIIQNLDFIDKVSGKEVFEAKCFCGKKWLTDSISIFGRWFGFRIQRPDSCGKRGNWWLYVKNSKRI